MKRLFFAVVFFLSLGFPLLAQNNIILFGDGLPALSYTTRTKRPGARLNYFNFFVRLPARAVTELQIAYPQGIGGIFQEDRITVIERRSGRTIPLRAVQIDRVGRGVRIQFQEAIPATRPELKIQITGVNNPANTGMYELVVQALGTEANPLFQTIGRWLVDIN